MENENVQLVFIRALLGSVESCTDVTNKLPKRIYFNFPSPHFDISDQKVILTELKKKRIILNFKFDDGDFVIIKPSKTGLFQYWQKLHIESVPEQKPVDTKIVFNEKTGEITKDGKVCPIPINTNQYFLCKALFAVPFGKDVTETDIVDMADWAKDTKRSVYDARGAVNKRVKEKLGINNFIRWRTGRVRIDYEQK